MLSGEDLLGSLVDSDLKFFEIFLIGLVFYVVHNISEVGFLSKDTFHIFDLLLNDSHINTHLSGGLVVLPDTFINLIVAATQQDKPCDDYLAQLQQQFPSHPFCAGLERVTAAFDREAVKYQV